MSTFNKRFRFLFCVIDIYRKCELFFFFKYKQDITIINVFQKYSDEPNGKPNKIWIDKGSEFYNRLMKSWVEKML